MTGPYAGEVMRVFWPLVDPIEQARWLMLRMWLDSGETLTASAVRSRIPRRRISEVLRGLRDPSFRDMAVWAYAHDCEFDVNFRRKGEWGRA